MAQDPQTLLQKAEKSLQGMGFFWFRKRQYENAALLYLQAATAYTLQYQHLHAGMAYEKAAEIHSNYLNNPDDAISYRIKAFNVLKETDLHAAVRNMTVVVERYCEKGDFNRAARHLEQLGHVHETQSRDRKAAMELYEGAANLYEKANMRGCASAKLGNFVHTFVNQGGSRYAGRPWLKVADIAALEGDYHKAIALYKAAAVEAIDSFLMTVGVREYLFKAGICYLATGDIVAARRALVDFRKMDSAFATQPELALLSKLVNAMENREQETFTHLVEEFGKAHSLDDWKITLLQVAENAVFGLDDEDFA
ncbi:hypothetical protein PCL_11311 [Purpureocillium lilacinum]|uniref:Vesicular-fusion protein sec17 n=1 Tax=Purpureocillium lilacinum TaxID=33203 RepID=A0A2U3DPW0_PURLI|nr:hypothetical protein PCL_11311 [Purpureocillium lilacinum]